MNIWAVTGLDNLAFLFREWKEQPTDLSMIKARKLAAAISKSKIDQAVAYAKDEIERLERAGNTVQSKAVTLMGATGISASFILGFSGFLIENFSGREDWSLWLGILFFVTLALSFGATTIFSLKTNTVSAFTYPKLMDVNILIDKGTLPFKREYLASLLHSARKNRNVVNVKTSYLIFAQKWFRNSVVLLLLLSILLSANLSLANLNTGGEVGISGIMTETASAMDQLPKTPLPTLTPCP